MDRNNYSNINNKYLIENRLYRDNSYNIILKKIYTKKNNLQGCRNLHTDFHMKKDRHDEIIFSIFNNAYYPKNNYNLEIFDFKNEKRNNSTSQNYKIDNNNNNEEEEEKNNKINKDIVKQLKELGNQLINRLDKIEEEQKNKQKEINYLLKKANNKNKIKENNKEKIKENLKINNKKKNKKKDKKIKVKTLGLYHRLAGGYDVQNYNVNRNMIIKEIKK